jgi:hypothetical protein
MIVQSIRLFRELEKHGFRSGRGMCAANSFNFIRPSLLEGLWESIIVNGQGKHGEAVYASVGSSVTSTVMYKEFGVVHPLLELAEVTERGWTIIETDSKALAWENELIAIGPQRAREWTTKNGPDLLRNTEQARQHVNEYLSHLKLVGNLEDVLTTFRATLSPPISDEYERISRSPGTSGALGTELAYELASYAILTFSLDVENINYLRGGGNQDNIDFIQRLHILADRLQIWDERAV